MKTLEDIAADIPIGRQPDRKVTVKLRCAGILIGDTWRGRGEEVELPEAQARALCLAGQADPVGVVAWFKLPAPAVQAPRPAAERLDRPGDGREYKVMVNKRRSVFHVDRAYGEGATVYLDEAAARLHVQAGNVRLVNPPGFPAHHEPVKPPLPEVGPYGCSNLVGAPPPNMRKRADT
jgi:hypothetical protein